MKRLILAGGGHSHIEVLRRFALNPPRDVEITLVTPYPRLIYTGMLPGLIAGQYGREESEIDIAALASRAGVTLKPGEVVGLDPTLKTVHLAGDTWLEYDCLSLNLGSTPPLDRIAGAAAHAVPVKPVDRLLAWLDSLLAQGAEAFPVRIAIIGAGAGGVELALTLEHRLRLVAGGRSFGEIYLVTDWHDIMPGHSSLARRWLRRILLQRGIAVNTGAKVVEVGADRLRSADGRSFGYDHVISTGSGPPPWLHHCGLATDEQGFVAVGDTLQSVSHPQVFAAGDLADMVGAKRPKAGVYAVRHGPVLARNLRCALTGCTLEAHTPQRHALAIIGTGEGYAVAARGPFALRGAWVWRLKERIDRKFVLRYR